jgi:hypothetical protein
MSWTVQIPSMCSSPNIIVNKKTKSKNQFTKTIRSKTNKYQKRKKLKLCIDGDFEKNKKIISLLSSINVIKSSIFQDI